MRRSSVLIQSKRRRRKALLRKIFFWPGVVVGVLVVSAGVILCTPVFHVQRIAIQGNAAITTDALEHVVRNILSGKSKMLLSNDNIFLIRTEHIEHAIKEAFPRIANIRVERSFPQGITITMEERHEWGIWCPGIALPTAATCYHINEESILFDSADILGEETVFVDRRMHLPQPGEQMLTTETFAMLKTFLTGLEKLKITVKQVIVSDEGGIGLSIETGEGWDILLDERTDAQVALDNLTLVLEKELKNRTNLEYVNLQFTDKVFYKRH